MCGFLASRNQTVAVTTEAIIGRLFGLSPSHARLTALLMVGRNTKQIAPVLTTTEGGTHRYRKRIFSKPAPGGRPI